MNNTSVDKLALAQFIYSIRKKDFLSVADDLDDSGFLKGVDNLMGHFSENYHGLLCDLDLENRIEERFFPEQHAPKPRSIKRVMHVASLIYDTGGHTKVIKEWLTDDVHSVGLVVTRQNDLEIQQLELNELKDSKVAGLGELAHIDKVKELARLYTEWDCDLMIVHHHHYDVIPFIVRKFLPEVAIAIYNHGDHRSWIGASLSDLVIDFRDCAQQASLERRAAPRLEKLPFKFDSSQVDQPKSDNSIHLLSMASAYKYIPSGEHDFFTFYADFLSNHPEVQMTIVGVDQAFFSKHTSRPCPNNLTLPGKVINPNEYLKKAHYFIEPFPLGSLLSCLDSCEQGAIPLTAYGHIHNIYGTGFASIFTELDYQSSTWSKEEYLRFLEEEIVSASHRKKAIKVLSARGESLDTVAWKKRVSEIYKSFEQPYERVQPVISNSSETYIFDLKWHELMCKDQPENFRAAILASKKLGHRDFLVGVWYAYRLKRSTGLYFPNNDFKIMFRKLFASLSIRIL